MQSAARVGLLVFVFGMLLIGSYAVLGRNLFGPKANPFYATFSDANGVSPGTAVMMAGVKVGIVSAVHLTSPKTALIKMEIEKDVQVPQGSIATISSSLIGFSPSPIDIVPPERYVANLLPGSTLGGQKMSALENLVPNSKQTVQELNK